MKSYKKEQLIIDKVRELIPKAEKVIEHYRKQNEPNNHSWYYITDSFVCLTLMNELKSLLGYKEDKIQPGTTCKNYKLFDDGKSL